MPTLLCIGPYRFFFWSRDCEEPKHIHIERDDALAKFWLSPVLFETYSGFRVRKLMRLKRLTVEYENELIERWNAFCH